MAENNYVKKPIPSSSATRRSVVLPAYFFSLLERSYVGFLKAFPKVRCWFAHVASSLLHQSGASLVPNFLFIFLPQLFGTAVQPPDSSLNTTSCASSFAQAVSNGSQSRPMPSSSATRRFVVPPPGEDPQVEKILGKRQCPCTALWSTH